MSWFSKLLGASGLIKDIGDVADKFITTDEDRNEFKLKAQALVQSRMTEIEITARAELDAKQKIMVAELQHGDDYTKRARPTVVYFGLIVIFFNYCLVPVMTLIYPNIEMTALPLPTEFWAAWGGIVATWSLGRSAEKRGTMNRVTGLITGSKVPTSLLD